MDKEDSRTEEKISVKIDDTNVVDVMQEDQNADAVIGDVWGEDIKGDIGDVALKEKYEEAVESESPKKKKKSTITSIIMLIVNISLVGLLASSLLKSTEDSSFAKVITGQGGRFGIIFYAILCFAIVMLADMLFISLILKVNTGKFRPFLCYRASAVGKYYEAITPLGAGGQPAQIVYLSKRKVSPGVATSIPLIRVILINLMSITVALLLFIFEVPKFTAPNGLLGILYGLLEILAYFGLILMLLYVVLMFVISNSKAVGRSLARWIVKLGYKLHVVKDYRASYRKFINHVGEYQNSIKYFRNHKGLLMLLILTITVEIISISSIPFVVTMSLSSIEFGSFAEIFDFYLLCLAKYYVCYMASSYIPLPGGTGMMEISFVIMFGDTLTLGANTSFIVWGFLLWRLLSYYIMILQGFVITIADFIAGNVQKKKVKK